jgi:putative transposase
MIARLRAFSQRHPREGSRKAGMCLRREGTRVNHKKVERLWQEHGLTVPVRRRQRRRGKGLERPLRPLYPNHVWAYDFMEDSCVGGRKLRILTVVDEFTRESHETYVDTSIPAVKVIEVLEFLFWLHGCPGYLRSDNGPEFIAKAIQDWLADQQIQTAYIDPGKPWQNDYGPWCTSLAAWDVSGRYCLRWESLPHWPCCFFGRWFCGGSS